MRRSLIEHRVASDLGFTEGPLWTSRGTLMAVGLSRGVVHELAPRGGASIAQVAVGGHPNGLAEGAGGDIWIAQAGHGATPPSIQRIRNDRVELFAGPFDAPNDLAFGPDGLLWFTDPRGNPMEGPPEKGRIWTLDPVNASLKLRSSDAFYPNGLAFSPTSDALYVAETAASRIVRYRLSSDLGAPETFAELPLGRPDGIAFDVAGNLYVAATNAGIVHVFDPVGRPIEELRLPESGFPTNLCFGNRDLKTLYITSPRGGRIYAIDREIAGLPLLDIG